MDNNSCLIVVSFNGEHVHSDQGWKYVNGDVFGLFVPVDVTLEAFRDMLYERFGLHRAYDHLSVKVLFSHMGLMPTMDITDDNLLRRFIIESMSKPNVLFCVNSTPTGLSRHPIIDLNEDADDLGEDMDRVEGDSDDEDEIGYIEEANTYRGDMWQEQDIDDEEELPFTVTGDRVEEIARDSDFDPFAFAHVQAPVPSYYPSYEPSSSRGNVHDDVCTSRQYEAGTSTGDFFSGQYHQSVHQPIPEGPSAGFLNTPMPANTPRMEVPNYHQPANVHEGPSVLTYYPEQYSWRMPRIDDSELTECPTAGTINNNAESDGPYLKKVYDTKKDFQAEMHKYALDNNFQMSLSRSEPTDCYYKCKDDRCKWHVRARKIKAASKQFHVTTLLDTHTCASRVDSNINRSAKKNIVADLLGHKLEQLGKNYKPANVMEDMRKEYGVELKYQQAYLAHEQMRMSIRGSPKECYSVIPSYLYMLQQANENTHVDVACDTLGRFSRCFISLGASRRGFRFCRPIICVDAAHLKTRYQGQLFIAIALDAGDHLFPVAIGVGEVECNDAWVYFMRHLRTAVEGSHREPLSFISDRHPSIHHAVGVVFPNAYHGYCYHHLKGNLNSSWKKDGFCEETFHALAYTCDRRYFRRAFNEFRQQCPGAAAQLEAIGFEHWTRAYFPAKRYAAMTSNYAESFNNVVREARRWPLPSMLEHIRSMLQRWFYERSNIALACTSDLAPEIEKNIAKQVRLKTNFSVEPVNMDEFNVVGHNRIHGVVNLTTRSCYCGYFQCLDYPCAHAVAAAGVRRYRISDLCGVYYKATAFKEIYMGNIYPVANQEDWDVPNHIKNMQVGLPVGRYAEGVSGASRRGRVNTTRRPSEWEREKRPVKCGNCNQVGHNRATCTQFQN